MYLSLADKGRLWKLMNLFLVRDVKRMSLKKKKELVLGNGKVEVHFSYVSKVQVTNCKGHIFLF